MKIGKIEISLWDIPKITGSGPPAVDTERMIEVPLGNWFINSRGPQITEVGAVTPYYYKTNHPVIDPNDTWPGCIKQKAEDLDYSDLNVLSISTIEHIYRGEYGHPYNPEVAINVLKKMMQAKNWLITWAVGYHKQLDAYIENNNVKSIKLHRTKFSVWAIEPSIKHVEYNRPFPYGNAIYVVTNCEELYNA